MSPVSCSPDRTPAWTAAPYATASSGLIPLLGSLPLKNSLTRDWILGILVEPPTRTISSTSFLVKSASSRTFWTGFSVPLKRSMFNSSNFDLVSSGQSSLGLLHLSPQLLHGTDILPEILALFLLVQLDEVLHYSLVEILTTQMSISVGSHYLKHSVVNGQEGHIKGTATKIEHKHILLTILLVHTVGNSSGGRFVDNSHHLKTSNSSSILGSLTLSIIEVGGNSNNGVSDLLAKVSFGSLLHLYENHGGDLLGSEHLLSLRSLDLDVRFAALVDDLEWEELHVVLDGLVAPFSANQTLGIEHCILGIGGQLILCCVSDQPLIVSSESNIAGGDSVSLVVGNDLNTTILKHSHARVSCSQVNSNNCAYISILLLSQYMDSQSYKQHC